MRENYLNYWGKTAPHEGGPIQYHPVAYHGLDVAAVLTILIREDPRLASVVQTLSFCDQTTRIPLLQLLAALHDTGKFSESFQNLNKDLFLLLQGKTSDLRYYPRHDSAGYLLFSEYLFDQLFSSETAPRFIGDPNSLRDDMWDLFHPLISSITGHHGAPPTSADITLKKLFSGETLTDINHFVEDCKHLFFKDTKYPSIEFSFSEDYLSDISSASFVFAGSIVLSDWIASNTAWFDYVPEGFPLDQYWKQYALRQAEKAVKETGILPVPINPGTGFSTLFPDIRSPYPIQKFCEEIEIPEGPGLYIIEDQCGMGKTESSLVLAHRLMSQGLGEGIFFALPTMATANSMFHRMGEFYSRLFLSSENLPEIVLTHSMSRITRKLGHYSSQESDRYSSDGEVSGSHQATSWLSDSRKKALLAHMGIGTIDQALMAILSFRHQSLRLLGLMRNVLIIDEVHSYDPYVHKLLCHLIEFHSSYGGSTILLSATLPLTTKKDLIQAFRTGKKSSGILPSSLEYPLFTVCSTESFNEKTPFEVNLPNSPVSAIKKSVHVSTVQSWQEIATIIEETISQGKCVVYIRNTVDDAREAYRMLSDRLGTERLLLFHARYVLTDRLRRETEILSRFGKEGTVTDRKGWVVIATQVLEQSLDIDFDLMITDLAPADLLIQRAGRIHRHNLPVPNRLEDRGPATLIIRAPPLNPVLKTWCEAMFPRGSYVYPDHGRLYLSLLAFTRRGEVTFPDDTRGIIEEVYGPDSFSMIPLELVPHTLKALGKDNTGITMADLNVLERSSGYVFSLVHWDEDVYTPTRLSELSYPVFLGRKNGTHIIPLYGEGMEGWYMSQILAPERLISKELSSVHESIADIPMNQDDCIVLLMTQDSTGWYGYAEDSKGRIKVTYNVTLGFVIERD